MQRRTVHYFGNVQGVGFRYTTVRVARRYTLDGYVRNLPDGRVELVAEGDPAELDRFLDDLADTMADHIRDVKVDSLAASGEFQGFNIRY